MTAKLIYVNPKKKTPVQKQMAAALKVIDKTLGENISGFCVVAWDDAFPENIVCAYDSGEKPPEFLAEFVKREIEDAQK